MPDNEKEEDKSYSISEAKIRAKDRKKEVDKNHSDDSEEDKYDSLVIRELNRIKYIINENESLDSQLLKRLINVVIDHELKIVEYLKTSGNSLDFSLIHENKRFNTTQSISSRNLAKLFLISKTSTAKWLDLLATNPLSIHIDANSLRKIEQSIDRNFPESLRADLYSIIGFHKDQDLIEDIIRIFNNHQNRESILSRGDLSNILSGNRHSLDRIITDRWETDRIAKFLRLITRIYCLEVADLDLKDPDALEKIKKEISNLIFTKMDQLGLFGFKKEINIKGITYNREKSDLRLLFDTIILVLKAFSKIKRNQNPENKYFVIEINELNSIIRSKKSLSKSLITNKFKYSYALKVSQIRRLVLELKQLKDFALNYCNKAIEALNFYLKCETQSVIVSGIGYMNYEPEFSNLDKIKSKPKIYLYIQNIIENGMDGGYPPEFFEDALNSQEIYRASSFYKRLVGIDKEIKQNYINKLIEKNVKLIKTSDNSIYSEFFNLIRFSDEKTFDSIVLGHGSPDHSVVQEAILENINNAIASEFPIWITTGNILLTGHIDIILVTNNTFYICDYKPELNPDPNAPTGESFINSIPQVASYGIMFKKMFGVENLYCITFNKLGMWIYEPYSTLKDITNFYKIYKKSIPEWEFLL